MNRDIDVMRLLAEARPAALDPDAGASARVLAAVMARAAAQPRPAPARVRRRAALALGGATAAIAAGLLALLALQVVPASIPARVPVPAAPPATSARDVLLAAAQRPATGPASGRYWRETTRTSSVLQTGEGAGAFLVEIGTQVDEWFAASASDRSWFISQSLGGHPLTAADEAAWRRAGSPDRFDVRVDKVGTVATATYDARPGQPTGVPIDRQSGVFDLGRPGVSLTELQQLPTDPSALRARLVELRRRGDPAAATDAPKDVDPWLFQAAGSLLGAPVSPEVRSAALRLLADLPGVTNAGQVTDPLGRTGTAVAMTGTDPLSGTVQRQLVIEPATGRLLASQTIVERPGTAEPWARPGLRISSVTTVQAGWTDETPPAVPPPGRG